MRIWHYYAIGGVAAVVTGVAVAVVLSRGPREPTAFASPTATRPAAVTPSPSSTASPSPVVTASPTLTPTPTPFALAAALKPVVATRVISGTTLLVARSAGVDSTTIVAVPVTASPAPGATGVPLATFGRNEGFQMRADGQILAVSLDTAPDAARIATWNLRSGAVAWLTPDEPGVRHATPVWSADGSLLYYASTRGVTDLGIFRIRADGTAATLVRKPDGKFAGVSLEGLTPDGTGLVWSYSRAGGSADVFDLASGTDRAFDDSTAASILAWRVARPRALVAVGGGAGGPPRQLSLWDDIARTARVLLGPGVAGSPDGIYSADWDPTGARLVVAAFTSGGTAGSSVLITMDANASARQTVTGSDGAQAVMWFRAGIAYTRRTAAGGTDLMLIQPSGGTPVTLFSDAGQLGRPTFVSP
jgi:hypothetical protein